MDNNSNPNNKIVRLSLSEILGIGPEDINSDDSLTHDLHLKPTDLTDLMEKLTDAGLDTSKIDFSQIDTVSDLEEFLEIEN